MNQPQSPVASIKTCLSLAIWFGLFTGLVEGLGLLVFQRVNWERWGPMMHVSEEILWISPIVDVLFFVSLSPLVWAAGRLWKGAWTLPVLVFALVFLAAYDWLSLTGRIAHFACILLSVGVAVALLRWLRPREQAALRLCRKTLAGLAILFAIVFAGVQAGRWISESTAVAHLPAAPPNSPDVLVIVVDTLRADHVSSYGYTRNTTPELDRLAKEGVLFENAVAPSSWSLPSHASLLTGRYAYEHGLETVEPEPWLGWNSSSMKGYPTLGEALQSMGYRTGAFSANRTYFSHALGFGRGFLHFEDYFHSPADMFVRTFYGREFARIYLKRTEHSLPKRILRGLHLYSLLDQDAEGSGSFGGAFGIRKRAGVVNAEVLRWIDRDSSHPFFAFLNYFDVHDPYGGPRWGAKPAWPQQGDVNQYDNGVTYVDEHLGELMRALEKRGLTRNLLVVVTSDHGEALGQHGQEKHGGALYWEQIRVPLIFWYPGHVPAGARISVPLSNATIPATILTMLGGENPFPGPSLDTLWNGANHDVAWPASLSELAQNKYAAKLEKYPGRYGPTAVTGPMKALVSGPWHLVQHDGQSVQLFDWETDPGEINNLISSENGQATARELESQLGRLLQSRTQSSQQATSPQR